MIQIRMGVADLGRTRFGYSPLAEIAESLYLLATRHTPVLHQGWLTAVRPRLEGVDLALLEAVVPPRPYVADFFFLAVTDRSTSVEHQLRTVATLPVKAIRRDLEEVWGDDGLPPPLLDLLQDHRDGPRRLADALWVYWRAAIEPYWPFMRAVLDDDVAHRAAKLTKRGIEGLLDDIHPDLSVQDDLLQIEKKRHPGYHQRHDLSGTGMLLVPSVFVWPNLLFAADEHGPPTLTYPARGIGNVWKRQDRAPADRDALADLLGRGRASILRELHVPRSTTELARSLGQSAPSVSQHLSVLRRNALVVSWRAGRRVLYRRTPLATSVVEASAAACPSSSA